MLAFGDRSHLVTHAPPAGTYQRPSVDERIAGGQDPNYNPTWRPSRGTVVFVGTVAIGLTVFELSEAVEVRYLDGKYVRISESPVAGHRGVARTDVWTHKRDMPSGKLCIRAYSPYPRAAWEKQWRETNPGDLGAKIPKIVRELEAEAGPIAKLVEEGERQAEIERREWEKEQRRWQREEAERLRRENIKRGTDQLLEIVDSWSLATRIEAFFEDAERRTSELAPNEQKTLADRLRRARELLGGVDALEHFSKWQAPEER